MCNSAITLAWQGPRGLCGLQIFEGARFPESVCGREPPTDLDTLLRLSMQVTDNLLLCADHFVLIALEQCSLLVSQQDLF